MIPTDRKAATLTELHFHVCILCAGTFYISLCILHESGLFLSLSASLYPSAPLTSSISLCLCTCIRTSCIFPPCFLCIQRCVFLITPAMVSSLLLWQQLCWSRYWTLSGLQVCFVRWYQQSCVHVWEFEWERQRWNAERERLSTICAV